MNIEIRLREATQELEHSVSLVTLPVLRHSGARPLLGAAVAAAAVTGVAFGMWWSRTASEAELSTLSPITTQAATSPASTRADRGLTASQPVVGPIFAVDPEENRPRVLARIGFDPGSLGFEYELIAMGEPESVRSWFRPVVWGQADEWAWTVVGQVAGFDMPVLVGRTASEAVVCAGQPAGGISCLGDGIRSLSKEENSAAVWLVPPLTEVVAFQEHDVTGWQIPSGGAVAFPRMHLSSPTTLAAYGSNGKVLDTLQLAQLEEPNPLFDQLPQPPTVDLLRVLLERGVPAVAGAEIIDTSSRGGSLLGVAEGMTLRLTHVDGMESYAFIASDGTRGIAFWVPEQEALNGQIEGPIVTQDHDGYVAADFGDGLLVVREIDIHEVVERWNASPGSP